MKITNSKCVVCKGEIVDDIAGVFTRYYCSKCGIQYEFLPYERDK